MRRLAKIAVLGLSLLALSSSFFSSTTSITFAAADVSGYPVIPSIRGVVYSHAWRLLYAGQRQGNRPDVFSKVGDSMTATPYFLYAVGNGGLRLGGYGYLQRTVNFFTKTSARTNNSFANDSLAAHGQWSTRDVLDPSHATPGVCNGGETPLDCELRVSKPAIALILFGANDVRGLSIDEFRANLERIVQITEAHGVIPVLSTTPNRLDAGTDSSQVNRFNLVIAQVAAEHSDPLWNFWRALNGLPNVGLASNDNIHPSIPDDHNTAIFDASHLIYGANVRNLTALQVLDALRTAILQ